MRDYIPKKKDINGDLGTVTVKQFDNNSRLLHVTLSDNDLADGTYGDSDAFVLDDCTAALYIQPEGDDDTEHVQFVAGEVADGENGVVTFLLPGGVTQVAGRYECEIWIYGGDETQPIISTKPFALIVEKSIKNDSAIEATQSMSALDAKIIDIQAVKNQMAALVASPAGSGGDVGTEMRDIRIGCDGTEYESAGEAVRGQIADIYDSFIKSNEISEVLTG